MKIGRVYLKFEITKILEFSGHFFLFTKNSYAKPLDLNLNLNSQEWVIHRLSPRMRMEFAHMNFSQYLLITGTKFRNIWRTIMR